MSHRFLAVSVCLSVLAACTTVEEQRKSNYRGTQNGHEVYEIKAEHWPTALWSNAKLEAWIKKDAKEMCPSGYRELSRRRGANHVYYGSPISMPYTDIHVTLECVNASPS